MAQPKKSAVYFVLITILLDVIGFGIIIPVLPSLLSEICKIPVNEASTYGGYLLTAFALMQFLFSPIMGGLSDQYGRRPVLLMSMLGFAVDYLILALAPDFAWLLIGRVIAGMFGASFSAASAYIADVSTEENRAQNFGMLGAAFGLGFIIGPFIGGIFGELGLRVPFYVASGVSLLNFLYGYFILPESLQPENRRTFNWKRANPIGTLSQLFNYKQIGLLLVALFLLYLGTHAINSNWTYFTVFRFKWSESTIGMSLAFAGLLIGVVQAGLAQKIGNWLGTQRSIYLGIGLYALGMLLFSFASASWMMFVFLIPYCLGGLCDPILKAYLVGQVPADEQGELQGGLTSIQSLTTIFGPLIMTNIFFFTTKDDTPFFFPGSSFLLAFILMAGSLVISWWVLRKQTT
ncbi:MAG: TCR/Tet family MFS transporter [Bacteroidota bacterium]